MITALLAQRRSLNSLRKSRNSDTNVKFEAIEAAIYLARHQKRQHKQRRNRAIASTTARRKELKDRISALSVGITSDSNMEMQRRPEPDFALAGVEPQYRLEPLLNPHDKDFIYVENYFERLLDNTNTNISEILEKHFSEREIRILDPPHFELGVATKIREHNTEVYLKSFEAGRFRRKTESLACKLTMQYFGMPVSPIDFTGRDARSRVVAIPRRRNTEYKPLVEEDDELKSANQFDWLDEYNPLRVNRVTGGQDLKSFPRVLLPQDPAHNVAEPENYPMNIRGGQAEEWDEEIADVEEDGQEPGTEGDSLFGPNVTANDKEEAGDKLYPYRIYGRQANARFGPTYLNFLEAVRRVLALPLGAGISQDFCLDLVDDVKVVQTLKATIEVDRKSSPANADVMSFVAEAHANASKAKVYLRYPAEPEPTRVEPGPEEVVLRFVAPSSLPFAVYTEAYMRFPVPHGYDFMAKTVMPEWIRTMGVLFPGPVHGHIEVIEPGENQPFVRALTYQDAPVHLIEMATRKVERKEVVRYNVALTALAKDVLPVFMPGRAVNTAAKLTRRKLENVDHVVTAIKLASIDLEMKKRIMGYEVWLGSQNFQNSGTPFFIRMDGKGAPAGKSKSLWSDHVTSYKNRESFQSTWNTGFCIVARPLFEEVTISISAPDFGLETEISMVRLDSYVSAKEPGTSLAILQSFLCTAAPFFAETPTSDYLDFQSDFQEAPGGFFHHAITAQTGVSDWEYIKRRCTTDRIRVQIVANPTRFLNFINMTKASIVECFWGPRYDFHPQGQERAIVQAPDFGTLERDPFKRLTAGASHYYSGQMSDPALNISYTTMTNGNPFSAGNNEVSHATMRFQAAYDTPSLFANPLKPVVPIHRPPIETMISSGPRVPSVSIGLRTPTEVARLERELHNLRAEILNKRRDCPYQECEQFFAYGDGKGFADHLRNDHLLIQCFMCPRSSNERFTFHDDISMRDHFNEYHHAAVQKLVQAAGRRRAQKGQAADPEVQQSVEVPAAKTPAKASGGRASRRTTPTPAKQAEKDNTLQASRVRQTPGSTGLKPPRRTNQPLSPIADSEYNPGDSEGSASDVRGPDGVLKRKSGHRSSDPLYRDGVNDGQSDGEHSPVKEAHDEYDLAIDLDTADSQKPKRRRLNNPATRTVAPGSTLRVPPTPDATVAGSRNPSISIQNADGQQTQEQDKDKDPSWPFPNPGKLRALPTPRPDLDADVEAGRGELVIPLPVVKSPKKVKPSPSKLPAAISPRKSPAIPDNSALSLMPPPPVAVAVAPTSAPTSPGKTALRMPSTPTPTSATATSAKTKSARSTLASAAPKRTTRAASASSKQDTGDEAAEDAVKEKSPKKGKGKKKDTSAASS